MNCCDLRLATACVTHTATWVSIPKPRTMERALQADLERVASETDQQPMAAQHNLIAIVLVLIVAVFTILVRNLIRSQGGGSGAAFAVVFT